MERCGLGLMWDVPGGCDERGAGSRPGNVPWGDHGKRGDRVDPRRRGAGEAVCASPGALLLGLSVPRCPVWLGGL